MAIFKFAPDIEHISSKIGGMVFTSSALGNYMKVSPVFNQWRTVWQNKRKRYMLACVQHWKMLTEAQREAWRDWAALYPQPQLLNDTEFINGYNLFCKRNFYRYMISDDTFTFMTDPVFDFYTETDTACEVLLGDGTLKLKATFSAPNNKLQALFFVSPPQSQGRKFGDQRWRFVGSMLATNQTIDITDMYLSYFGILPEIDDHLFASVILCGIDQGQFTFHELIDIIVSPDVPPIYLPKFGYVYNFFTIADTVNLLTAANAHIPSNTEFSAAISFLGGLSLAGGPCKDTDLTFWNTPNTGATNSAKFNGRGAGYRNEYGGYTSFKDSGTFWTSTPAGSTFATARGLSKSSVVFSQANYIKKSGFSVRVVMNSTTLSNGQEGTYTGNDGKLYRTICINNQEWLADNLVETKTRNGSDISLVTNGGTWAGLTTGAYAYANGNPDNT